jgi:hypothetical protein
MVASLLRVIHTGLQDERLLPPKGQPSIDFFTKAFYKAGRFTTSWVRLDFDTRPNFSTTATITLPRQGHMISRLYLVTTLPDIATPQIAARKFATDTQQTFLGPTFGWTNSLGHALVTNASLEIGGARVEQITGQLMEILEEFNTPLEKVTLMNEILPRAQNGFRPGLFGLDPDPQVAVTPLPFWFSRGDAGAFYPIDAIGVDLTRVSITFAPVQSLYVSSAQTTHSNLQEPGSAYYPLLNSPFYISDPGNTPVPGLTGNPSVSVPASKIPGITIPSSLSLGDTYLLAEYVYLDRVEANRFRISDILYPITQHYIFEPVDSVGQPRINIPLRIPNPSRDIFFYCQRSEAISYNAPFLATRDLSGLDISIAPWWPDASGLNTVSLLPLVPAFSTRESEPLAAVTLFYEGKMQRYSSMSPSILRSLLPSYEQRKSPWINRYYYNLTFGTQNGLLPPSIASGQANLSKIERINLELVFQSLRGSIDPNCVPSYRVFVYAETYNILRIYGGRAGLLFAY